MNSGELFPDKSDIKPVIYAYELVGVESHRGYINVGYTLRYRSYLPLYSLRAACGKRVCRNVVVVASC